MNPSEQKTKEEILDQSLDGKLRGLKWIETGGTPDTTRQCMLNAMQEYADQQVTAALAEQKGLHPINARDRIPPVGIYHATYNGDHVIFQVHDGGFRVINYHGEMNDAPQLHLIKWFDESESTLPTDGEKEAALREFANWMDNLPYFMAHGQCKVNGTGMLQEYKSSLETNKKP